jgi:hypothetical protein
MFNGGWESLLFVMLNEQSTPPAWLPKSHIRLNYTRFCDDLVGAIKYRAVELGSKLVTETAVEKAKRVESIAAIRRERSRKLTYADADSIAAEWQSLCHLLDEKLAEIQLVLSTAKLESDKDADGYLIRTTLAGLNLRLRLSAPASESEIAVFASVGHLILPKEHNRMYVPGYEPDCISTHEFRFDYNAALGWCWRLKASEDSEHKLFTTAALSELVMKQIVELHEQVESGKVVRRRRSQAHPRPLRRPFRRH